MPCPDPQDEVFQAFFYTKPIENKRLSLEQERPVFTNKEYLILTRRGTGKEEYHGAASDSHKERFPDQYNKFLDDKDQNIPDGLLLKEVPFMNREEVAICEALKIYTAEQLVQIKDSDIKRLGLNGRKLVESAKNYLGGNSVLKSKVEEQAQTIEELKKMVEDLTKGKPKKRVKKDESTNDSTEGGQAG